MMQKITVTQDNVFDVAGAILLIAKHSDYNSNCFGVSNIKRYLEANDIQDNFYSKMVDAGYNPIVVFDELQTKLEYPIIQLSDEDWSQLRTNVDENLMFEINITSRFYNWGISLLEEHKKIVIDKSGRMAYHPDYHFSHGLPFTESDLEYICKYYESDETRNIAFAIGKTEHTIRTKINHLKKNNLYDYYKNLNRHWV